MANLTIHDCFLFAFSIVYRDDACDAKKGSQAAMDLVLNEKVHAIIGTVCSEGMKDLFPKKTDLLMRYGSVHFCRVKCSVKCIVV